MSREQDTSFGFTMITGGDRSNQDPSHPPKSECSSIFSKRIRVLTTIFPRASVHAPRRSGTFVVSGLSG